MFKKHNLLLILAFFICIVLSCEYHTNPPVIIPGEPNEIGAKNISYRDPYRLEQYPIIWSIEENALLYVVEDNQGEYYHHGIKPTLKDTNTYDSYDTFYNGYGPNFLVSYTQNGDLLYGGAVIGDMPQIYSDSASYETEPVELTIPGVPSIDPQLAPDYTKIIFDSQRSPDHADIYMMDPIGELEGPPAQNISNLGPHEFPLYALFSNNSYGVIYKVNKYYDYQWYYYNVNTQETITLDLDNYISLCQWIGPVDVFLAYNANLSEQCKFPLGYIDISDGVFHPFFPDATCFPKIRGACLSPNHHTLAFIAEVNDSGDRDVFLVEVEVPPLN